MNLSNAQIEKLITGKSISEEWPWSTNNEATVDNHIKDIIYEVRRKMRLLDKTEYGHYGSGYASYVDSWLYRNDEKFRLGAGNNFVGMVVLFSRLSKFYVAGEGAKTWTSEESSSYLVNFDFVDKFQYSPTRNIANDVCSLLESRGLTRLFAHDLSEVLPGDINIPTILSEPPYRHFDALYYWED